MPTRGQVLGLSFGKSGVIEHRPCAATLVALIAWWGPNAAVTCPSAEIDLRVGGRYRIANRFPDGRLLWIAGEFEVIEPPSRLFEAHGDASEVIVTHERIADAAAPRATSKGG